jgi:hypothetical protein
MMYFAYGADMSPSRLLSRSPGHKSLGIGRLPDHRLTFPRFSREWGGATASLTVSPGDVVFGALYDVPPDDIPILHHHHGYDPEGPPELSEHVFREVSVRRQGAAEPVSAWAYFAVPDNTTARPSRRYIAAIIDGAIYHRLPRAYLVVLQSIRTA